MIPEINLNSDEIIAREIRKFWKETGYAREVIAFFYQKHKWENEKEWLWCEELATPDGFDDFETVYFEDDFCEGENEVKDITIVPLDEITEYYAWRVLGRPRPFKERNNEHNN